jgi:hypothetical protein
VGKWLQPAGAIFELRADGTVTFHYPKGYDSGPFFVELENRGVEPHCAVIELAPPKPENVAPCRRQAVAARERMKTRLRTFGYELSQRCRKKIEEYFAG